MGSLNGTTAAPPDKGVPDDKIIPVDKIVPVDEELPEEGVIVEVVEVPALDMT